MIEVKDRVPTKPNRIKLVSEEDGTSKYYTLSRADEPTVDGTPINKALFDSIQVDLIDKGIVDPTKALIEAYKNAISVSLMLLSTECVVQ